MASVLLRRRPTFATLVKFCPISRTLGYSLSSSTFVHDDNESQRSFQSNDKEIASKNGGSGIYLSPFFSDGRARLESCRIEIVDEETWRVSSGLVEAWKGTNRKLEANNLAMDLVDENVNIAVPGNDNLHSDEIDDMRVRGNLFYKIDRDSKEFEEYSLDFHGRKKLNNKNDRKERENKKSSNDKLPCGVKKSSKEERKGVKNTGSPGYNFDFKSEALISSNYEMGSFGIEKKVRTPTFNQLTAPYHEPFCLDIYVSKGSVRACIIHRATSKVIAVAHSISKDMKFDLSSKKNKTTCAAVGEVLAQRALADDIHNVVYTPRKEEKLEGKLQIVLQSIIDNGVNVKVKIKQRKLKKVGHSFIG